jgi:hypothetical protein
MNITKKEVGGWDALTSFKQLDFFDKDDTDVIRSRDLELEMNITF